MIIPTHVMKEIQANPNIGRIELAKVCCIAESEARHYVWLVKQQNQSKKVVTKGVCLYDIHYPEHNTACLNIAFKFIKNFRPDIFVFGGDQMDMGTISSFNTKKPKLTESKRLKKEYIGFQKDVLDKLKLPKKCERYWITGNHEQRLTWLIEALPQYEGFIEPENNLDLKNWRVSNFGEMLQFGELSIAHGSNYGMQHAKQNVQQYGMNIFTGHSHTNQIFTMNSPVHSLPRQGVSIGCLCNKNPDYKSGTPNSWIHQFLVFWIFEDGSFAYEIPTILNNQAVICGKHYHFASNVTSKTQGDVVVKAV